LLVTFLIPVSALLLGIGVLGEVIHVLENAGMGGIWNFPGIDCHRWQGAQMAGYPFSFRS